MAGLSKRTQADIEEIKAAWADFHERLKTPWTLIGGIALAIVYGVMMWLPWMAE